MEPTPIDLATWPRREHFEHYLHSRPCRYSLTIELDITKAVAAQQAAYRKTFPSQIWALAAAVNRLEAFRMCLVDRQPAVWPHVDPAFPVFNPERETTSWVTTPFDEDFGRFHDVVVELQETHHESTEQFPQGALPANCFEVSVLPTAFTGLTLQVEEDDRLLPIFTIGRRVRRDDRVLLPLAVQVHHAAVDGFHVHRLVSELKALAGTPSWLT